MSRAGRMKVATVVGTRPEIIKLSSVIPALDRAFRHVVIHTGQNYDYELNEVFFKGFGLRKPDHFLEAAGATPAQTVAAVIARVDPVLEREAPDALLLLGDTNSCLAAIAAKRRRIPVFHMEAGNRCFDERVPEEINRRIVDHISDVNLPYTEHARRYLLAEGLRPDLVITTGSPMKQVLASQRQAIARSRVLGKLGLRPGAYFVASAHREENVDEPRRLARLLAALEGVSAAQRRPVIFSTHPRTRKRIEALRTGGAPRGLRFLAPLGFADYIRLQSSAACVLSDSGTLTEEASLLGFPAVMLREAHERPEGMDEGVLAMAGIDPDRVLEAVELAMTRRRVRGARRIVPAYDVDDVAAKVVNTILSYTGYVRRVVWRDYAR